MGHNFQSSFLTDLVLIFLVFFLHRVQAFPSGAPLSACGQLLPVHVDGEQQNSASPYVLILNDTSYGSQPLKLTITTVGSGTRDFMAFMLQARSEFGKPAGYFSDVPRASKTLACYENDDTLTHTAAFIRPGMEVLWHPPSKNIGKISIQGSIALSKIKFWAVESSALTGTGPIDKSSTAVQIEQNRSNTSGNQGIVKTNGAANVVGSTSNLSYLLPMFIVILVHVFS